MSKTFRLRVEGIREAPEGKVTVDFTNRQPPRKPKKGRGGMCVPDCYDGMPSMNIYSLPMSKEEAESYPVGAICKVTLEPTGDHVDSDDEEYDEPDEKPSRKDRLEKAAMAAAKRVG